jgi:hypothetical protein
MQVRKSKIEKVNLQYVNKQDTKKEQDSQLICIETSILHLRLPFAYPHGSCLTATSQVQWNLSPLYNGMRHLRYFKGIKYILHSGETRFIIHQKEDCGKISLEWPSVTFPSNVSALVLRLFAFECELYHIANY